MSELKCPYCNSIISSEQYKEVEQKVKEEFEGKYEKKIKELEIKERDILLKEKNLRGQLEKEIRENLDVKYQKELDKINKEKEQIKENKLKITEDAKNLKERERELKKTIEEDIKNKYATALEKDRIKIKEEQEKLASLKKQLTDQKQMLQEKEKEIRKSIEMEFKTKFETALEKEKLGIEREKLKIHEVLSGQKERFETEKQRLEQLSTSRNKELEKTIESLRNQIEHQSLHELGDLPEERLLSVLEQHFREDICKRIGKGKSGGDVVQTVMYKDRECGRILYESKNTKTWSNKWLDKIKNDKALEGADYIILVTKAFPSDEKYFTIMKDVVVVSPKLMPHIARIIRETLIEAEKRSLSEEEREKKISLLYSYLKSPEFKNSITIVNQSITNLEKLRTDEKRQHERNWATQSTEINQINTHFSTMIGSIQSTMESEVEKKKKKKILSEIR